MLGLLFWGLLSPLGAAPAQVDDVYLSTSGGCNLTVDALVRNGKLDYEMTVFGTISSDCGIRDIRGEGGNPCNGCMVQGWDANNFQNVFLSHFGAGTPVSGLTWPV